MRFLVDTHVWLWMLAAPERLNEPARIAIANTANSVFLSVASVWEIGIKRASSKLNLPAPLDELVSISSERFNTGLVPVTVTHALIGSSLPPLHKDPFDRMLVAQAQVEELTLVTGDKVLREYSCPILWAA